MMILKVMLSLTKSGGKGVSAGTQKSGASQTVQHWKYNWQAWTQGGIHDVYIIGLAPTLPKNEVSSDSNFDIYAQS